MNFPKATVASLIFKSDNNKSILLTRRSISPFMGKWCLPGGHIDKNETALDAIKREVKEETGLDYNPDFFKYFDEILPDSNIHNIVLVFNGIGIGELKPDPKEVSQIAWLDISKAKSLKLAFGHEEIINSYSP